MLVCNEERVWRIYTWWETLGVASHTQNPGQILQISVPVLSFQPQSEACSRNQTTAARRNQTSSDEQMTSAQSLLLCQTSKSHRTDLLENLQNHLNWEHPTSRLTSRHIWSTDFIHRGNKQTYMDRRHIVTNRRGSLMLTPYFTTSFKVALKEDALLLTSAENWTEFCEVGWY